MYTHIYIIPFLALFFNTLVSMHNHFGDIYKICTLVLCILYVTICFLVDIICWVEKVCNSFLFKLFYELIAQFFYILVDMY